jgi:hypothetical protein
MDNPERVLEVTKMKDAPSPEPMGFKLAQVTLPWRDEEGNPETSVVLVPTGAPVAPKKDKKSGPTALQKLGFETLLLALETNGSPAPWEPESGTPNPEAVVHLEDWRPEFYARHTGKKQDTKKTAFQRVRKDLTEIHVIGVRDDHYWPTPENGPWPGFGLKIDPSAPVQFKRLSTTQPNSGPMNEPKRDTGQSGTLPGHVPH